MDANGGLVAQVEVEASQGGYEQLLGFVTQQAPGRRCWTLEGTGCYGAGLTSFLLDHGEWVTEIDRPNGHVAVPAPRVTPWTRSGPAGKRSAASGWPARASGGQREALRVLQALTAAPTDPVEYRATVRALRTTAERALAAHQEARQLGKELGMLARVMAPTLLAQLGVGPVTAAQVRTSWSHPGRLRSKAAFAMLAGAAPVEASSGRVIRHRLNRGGDRHLNRALPTIIMIRERTTSRLATMWLDAPPRAK